MGFIKFNSCLNKCSSKMRIFVTDEKPTNNRDLRNSDSSIT